MEEEFDDGVRVDPGKIVLAQFDEDIPLGIRKVCYPQGKIVGLQLASPRVRVRYRLDEEIEKTDSHDKQWQECNVRYRTEVCGLYKQSKDLIDYEKTQQ